MGKLSIPSALFGWASVRYLEIDNSSFISNDASLAFGSLGHFSNGPVMDIIKLADKTTLAGLYGEPFKENSSEWWNIARAFQYKSGIIGPSARICRVVGDGSFNQALAVTNTKVVDETELTTMYIGNADDAVQPTVVFDEADDASKTRIKFFSKYPTAVPYKIALCNVADFATAEIFDGVKFSAYLDPIEGTQIAYAVVLDSEVIEIKVVDLTEGNVDDENINTFIETKINETSEYLLAYLDESVAELPVSFEATAMLKGAVVQPVKADYIVGLELFENWKTVNVNYMIPHSTHTVKETNTLINNRLDAQMIWTPPVSVLVGKNAVTALADLITYATTTENFTSTYAECFGNAGFFYDEYSKKNIWGELAGDLIGLRILKNLTGNPWEASAGLNNGQFKNIIKLAINFKDSAQIELQRNKINSIVNETGKGIFSWGIQNYTSKKSALIDSTTRGLLVTIWRAMRESLQWDLFEINDETTQSSLRIKTNIYMKNIESNRGVSNVNGLPAFKVICDSTNNTPAIVQAGQLVLQLKLVPSRIAKEIILVADVNSTGATLTES